MRRVLQVVISLLVFGSATAAASASVPSRSACAVAWNRGASARLHSTIANAHARGAFINLAVVDKDSFTRGGGSTSTSKPGCSIAFILRDGETLNVWGAWNAGKINLWFGPITSTHVYPVPNNAR